LDREVSPRGNNLNTNGGRSWLRRFCFCLAANSEQKSINRILADPHWYVNQEVGVAGKVARSYSFLGHGAYEVDDGTGTLWVISTAGVPRESAHVGVKGTIHGGFNLGELGGPLEITGIGAFRRGSDGI
jgi:hypothetical protein